MSTSRRSHFLPTLGTVSLHEVSLTIERYSRTKMPLFVHAFTCVPSFEISPIMS